MMMLALLEGKSDREMKPVFASKDPGLIDVVRRAIESRIRAGSHTESKPGDRSAIVIPLRKV